MAQKTYEFYYTLSDGSTGTVYATSEGDAKGQILSVIGNSGVMLRKLSRGREV